MKKTKVLVSSGDSGKRFFDQSAMSMLNFYINRAGKNLTDSRKRILNLVKLSAP